VKKPSAFQIFRKNLVPRGTLPVVKLFLSNSAFFDESKIKELINYLEMKTVMVANGIDEFSPSDLIALEVLRDSSFYEDTIKSYKTLAENT
jgi:hypothetical protein